MSAQAVNGVYASNAAASAGGLHQPAVNGDLAAKAVPPPQKKNVEDIHEKYAKERKKRLRAEGQDQFTVLINSEKYKHLAGDRWADKDKTSQLPLKNGMHTKVFIIGGGFGGLLNAVRLRQTGFKPEDIILADVAGGYGGTWYWNRYPGLMCDVESYIYLPLLEETGYMPKHKYSYGSEIRGHVNRIAKHWNLENRGAFQQQVNKLDWDENAKCWKVETLDLKTNQPVHLTAEFVVVAPGLLHQPKFNEFPGIDKFQGHIFHTARWDYDYTGGSQENPLMANLKGKRVGIIGTGATAIQAVPHLARFARELYIFQRTPSAVDTRGQRLTDPEDWAKNISSHKGWQWERTKNFNCFLNDIQPPPAKNLVDDGWSHFPSYSALLGGPKEITVDNVEAHVASLHAADVPRQEYIRSRVDSIVKDTQTAQSLKPWYAGWCKRPCFHDEYLQSFNLPNVHLIDTDGKGITGFSTNGILANDTEYPLDLVILGTGYSLNTSGSPTGRAGITAHGRNGKSLDEKWDAQIATLHGVLSHDFPNLIFSGPTQATVSANFSSALDLLSQHAAYIVAQAMKNAGSDRVTIEPSVEAEEAWSTRCMEGAFFFAAMSGCTPSYLNGEGASDELTMEQKMKAARGAMWSRGMNDFAELIGDWRRDGALKGLEVVAV